MSPQESIAHYRIISKLGEGGMGAVYRATDTKLGREVAIKVLPESFAQDPDRLARFTREAQVLASLNHPNIAMLFGVEERALVMELVEGATFAERIAQGPIPLEDALPLARQVAEALEYAHDRGIVHRDLKPANVKVTPEGRVKVLDFGLAKALSSDVPVGDPGLSATLTMRATMAGLIMGTPGYMSPEQAKGKPVDRRSDIWAFGVLLAEMLTGRLLYSGETVSETLASVIKDQPDLGGLPVDTPPSIRRLVKRCLEKDPQRRLQSIGEARIAIDDARVEEAPAVPAVALAAAGRGIPWWTLAVAVVPTLVLGVMLWRATRPVDRPMQRFVAELGEGAVAGIHTTAILSPDGTRVVFPVQQADGAHMLATRMLEHSKMAVISGTENGADPFFSPDGNWIAFTADQKLKKVPIQGGAVVTLCEAGSFRGADWGEDGNIIANLDNFHLAQLPAAGGTPRILTKPEDRGERTHRWPQILPGGEAVLFTANVTVGVTAYDDASIEVLSLKTGQIKIVQRGGYYGRYIPSSPGGPAGQLIFVHQGTLFAAPFDAAQFEVRGTPLPVVEGIAGNPLAAGGQLSFSRTGTLVYLPGTLSAFRIPLLWIDTAGSRTPLLDSPLGRAFSPRFSPDGKRLAVSLGGDIQIYDLERGALSRITNEPGRLNSFPEWTPDSQHLVYAPSSGGIRWLRSDGSGQPQVLYDQLGAIPSSFSPDGRSLAFHQASPRSPGREIWILPVDAADPEHPKAGTPELFVSNRGSNVDPAFSPDGRWLAYASNESDAYHVLVRPFGQGAKAGGQVQVSNVSGRFPVWSRAANELFYTSLDGQIMSVHYTIAGAAFTPGVPHQWSETRIVVVQNMPPMGLAPDGKRIAASASPQGPANGDKANLHVVFLLNFFDELRRRVK